MNTLTSARRLNKESLVIKLIVCDDLLVSDYHYI